MAGTVVLDGCVVVVVVPSGCVAGGVSVDGGDLVGGAEPSKTMVSVPLSATGSPSASTATTCSRGTDTLRRGRVDEARLVGRDLRDILEHVAVSGTRTTMYFTTPSASSGSMSRLDAFAGLGHCPEQRGGFTAAGAGGAGVAIVGTNVIGAAAGAVGGAVATGSAGGSASCTTGAGGGAGGASRA